MLYNLVLVVFLSNGLEHRVPLINKVSGDNCIEFRDSVRGQISYLNDLPEVQKYNGDSIEFVDAECVAQKIIY